jgi:hypothetical protein
MQIHSCCLFGWIHVRSPFPLSLTYVVRSKPVWQDAGFLRLLGNVVHRLDRRVRSRFARCAAARSGCPRPRRYVIAMAASTSTAPTSEDPANNWSLDACPLSLFPW